MSTSSIVQLAHNWVIHRGLKNHPDPDATLKFFQELRTTPQWRKMYLEAAGCSTGFEVGHHGKATLNRQIGRAIKAAMNAENDPQHPKVEVEDEFIETYQRFLPR